MEDNSKALINAKSKKLIDITGEKYNYLTVIKEVERKGKYIRRWLCECDCGKMTEVNQGDLRNSHIKSCGCLHKKAITKHGFYKHPVYNIICDMIRRCYNPNDTGYKWYGAKGITVCKEWKDDHGAFVKWALSNGWKKGLQIDRANNKLGYSPNNCRFVTNSENSANQSMQSNNTSGYTGITRIQNSLKYRCRITNKGKEYHLGSFDTIEQALIVRNKYIIDNKLFHTIQTYKGENNG